MRQPHQRLCCGDPVSFLSPPKWHVHSTIPEYGKSPPCAPRHACMQKTRPQTHRRGCVLGARGRLLPADGELHPGRPLGVPQVQLHDIIKSLGFACGSWHLPRLKGYSSSGRQATRTLPMHSTTHDCFPPHIKACTSPQGRKNMETSRNKIEEGDQWRHRHGGWSSQRCVVLIRNAGGAARVHVPHHRCIIASLQPERGKRRLQRSPSLRPAPANRKWRPPTVEKVCPERGTGASPSHSVISSHVTDCVRVHRQRHGSRKGARGAPGGESVSRGPTLKTRTPNSATGLSHW